MCMIKLICSDYDGCLADLCQSHFISLNKAIEEVAGIKYIISEKEHYADYNGLSTKTKLQKLVETKNLPEHLIGKISSLKQEYTIVAIEETVIYNETLVNDFSKLKSEGFKLVCVSNAITETVELGLKQIGLFDVFDLILGNEAVKRQKPYPDLYLQAMITIGVGAKETLVIEDSENGLQAAIASQAYILKVSPDTKETTYENIKNKINSIKPY